MVYEIYLTGLIDPGSRLDGSYMVPAASRSMP